MSTHHEKKPPRALHNRPAKSPITTPPRAALGRSKIDHGDNASIKSSATADSSHTQNGSPGDDLEDSGVGSNLSPGNEVERDKCEKDRKIMELEKELNTMTSEFEKELTQLSHKVTNERESSQFWQQKHTTLHQTYLQTDTSLRLLRSELANIQSSQSANLEKDREVKSKLTNVMMDRDAFREAYNEAMGELREKEEEVEMLRGQVRGLKSWVSKGGRGGEEQVSDEGVGEGWGKLGNSLQNWVIVNFRRTKVDTDKADPELKDQLQRLLPSYETLASSSKIHFIQSLISRLFVNTIFSSYFVGIPSEQAEELEKVERYLGEFGPEETINQWRSATLSLLRKEASTKLLAETQIIVDSLTATINTLLSSVADLAPSEPRDSSLRLLISSSIDLSRLLRAQKAVFTVQMPALIEHQLTIFDGEEMEDVGGEDEEELSGREIRCVVFPGVVKWGDENGERGYLKNVVAKTKVLCAPE